MHAPAFPTKKAARDKGTLFRQICYSCFRPRSTCLCSGINAFSTHTRFVILMHPKEARKVKLGTGRLTHLYLKNSEILSGVDFTEDQRVNSMIEDPAYYPVIMYPGENSTDISEFHFPEGIPEKRKILVFVIDASWTLARKILRQSTNLSALPKIHFRPQGPSRYVIKQQPHKFCLSTIESVYFLLEELNKLGIEECRGKNRSLLEILDKMCRHQVKCFEDTALPGYRKETVKPSGKRKWPDKSRHPGKRQRRSVYFD